MAEALFKGFLRKKFSSAEALNWLVASAGTWAAGGENASPGAQAVMEQRDLTLSDHHSQQVTSDLLGQFNLVLVMEKGQKEALQKKFPQHANKIHLFSEMVGAHYDIEDPIGGDILDYERAVTEIEALISLGFEEIRKLAGNHPKAPKT